MNIFVILKNKYEEWVGDEHYPTFIRLLMSILGLFIIWLILLNNPKPVVALNRLPILTQENGQIVHQGTNTLLVLPNISLQPDQEKYLPLTVQNLETQFVSADINLIYDTQVINIQSVEVGSLTSSWMIASNEKTIGTLQIAMAGSQPVSSDGEIIRIQVVAIGNDGSSSEINFTTGDLNEGQLVTDFQDGYISIAVPTATNTPTPTLTYTPSLTPTDTPTPTLTYTPSLTPTDTPTPTLTYTPSLTPTVTPTPTLTYTPSLTPTDTPTPTLTYTPSLTPTVTPTPTLTYTPSLTPTDTPTPTLTYTPTETPVCTFSGIIDLQGRSNASGATFFAGTYSTTSDASGNYELSVPSGTYNLTAETDRYLYAERMGESCPAGGMIQIPAVTLLGGDANDDCAINILDLAFIGSRYLLSAGDPNFSTSADINADGTIDILDLTVAGGNFMEVCPVDW